MPWHRLASSCTAAFPETRTKRFWHFLQGLLDTILTYTAATTDMEKENTPAAAMDTVLPVVVGATHERIAIYSFTSGVVLSLAVPLLVPAIVTLPF